jgi:MFS transporter, PPP family, 3-phenylpropionic acid transporter
MKGCSILELLDRSVPAPAPSKMRLMGSIYFFFFVAFGALYTLMPLYLQQRGMSATQIGAIATSGTLMTVVFQPIWGMLCDRFHKQRLVLMGTLFGGAIIAIFYPFTSTYLLFLVLFAVMAMFHSSGIPIIDSASLSYIQRNGGDYGSLRLWGAIGFAFASWFAGRISGTTGLQIIFWLYAGAMLVCVLLARELPLEAKRMTFDMTRGLKTLFRMPRFLMLMIGDFLIFGAIQANNSYYSMFYVQIGGTVAGVGLSFLIAAGSEAPVMRIAGRVAQRIGGVNCLIIAGLISALRWLFYGFAPSPGLVIGLIFVQGLSVGLYLPAGAQYVREISPKEIQTTALGIYSAMGNGLGSMACTLAGGIMLDRIGVFHTYTMFGIISLVGTVAMASLRFMPQR